MKKTTHAIVIFALMMFVISCATTGPGGKTSVIIVPEQQEIAIGAGMSDQVLSEEKVLNDQDWQLYLNEIGQKIVRVCDRKNIEYHFTVIESDQINAFAAPGGYIFFYTGLLKEMENEAELAAVVAHEISHVVARHSVKRIQAALGVSVAYQLIFGEEGSSEALNAAIGIGMGLTMASYSRSNEREADDYGLQYLVKAGYNPNGAVTMYEKLARMGAGGSSVFEQLASTHPDSKERIENAKNQIRNMSSSFGSLNYNTKRYNEMKSRLK